MFDALPNIEAEGVSTAGRTFTLPECDAAGAVVGIGRRFPDGSKRHLPGGKRGLTLTQPRAVTDPLDAVIASALAAAQPGPVRDWLALMAAAPDRASGIVRKVGLVRRTN